MYKSQAILFLFLFPIAVAFSSVAPPALHCITVLSNGEVRIDWTPPSDPSSEFDSYHIYVSTSSKGPFALLDSIFNYATSTFSHSGANATTDTLFYYVKTRFNASGLKYSSSSDTLQTMMLSISTGTAGMASLSWNNIHTPKLLTSSNWCHIYREYPIGSWLLIDSVLYGANAYADPLIVCADSIQYWISLEDASGCTSVSIKQKEWFTDKLPPAIPVIDSVSVDATTGNTVIGWQPSTSGDVDGYIIARNIGSNWALDTVWGINNTFSMDTASNPSTKSEKYGVAAFDSCWLGNPPSPNISPTGTLHSTIYVKGTLNQCARSISLSWNTYKGWSAVSSYAVYVGKDGGATTLLATKAANDTTFTHTNLTPNASYCYSIRATSSTGITSTSNRLCMTMYIPQQPKWLYITNVSIVEENLAQISYYVDVSADVQSYLIQRSTDTASNGFKTIAEQLATNDSLTTYIDNQLISGNQTYYYRILAKDVCGSTLVKSNTANTLFCSVDINENMLNAIQWNAYIGWDAVGSFSIYRSNDESFDDLPIATVSATTFNFLDDISAELTANGNFCYYIEAEEATLNNYGFKEKAQSNIFCVYYEPIFWIPNAFTPNGDNRNEIFQPVLSFIPSQDYLFIIYNRWGDTVFETTNIEEGWDGTLNNQAVQNGIYMYYLTYKTGKGKPVVHSGDVMLLK